MICQGCGNALSPMDAAMSKPGLPICLECVKARARTATTGGRCKCGAKKRPGGEIKVDRRGGRSWIPCVRCLGVIRQTG